MIDRFPKEGQLQCDGGAYISPRRDATTSISRASVDVTRVAVHEVAAKFEDEIKVFNKWKVFNLS